MSALSQAEVWSSEPETTTAFDRTATVPRPDRAANRRDPIDGSLRAARLADLGGLTAAGAALVLAAATPPTTSVLLAVVCAALATTVGTPCRRARLREEVRALLVTATALAAVCWLLLVLAPQGVSARELAVPVLILLVTLAGSRSMGGLAQRRQLEHVLLTGRGEELVDARADVSAGRRLGQVHLLDLDRCDDAAGPGDPVHIATVARALGVTSVVALPSAGLGAAALRRLGWELEASGVDLAIGTGLRDVSPARTATGRMGGLAVVHVRHRCRAGVPLLVKGSLERTSAALLLALLAPVLAVVAVAVRLDSPGPVVFRQQRVGRDGALFTMLKFRTMAVDAESSRAALERFNESDGVLFKLRVDPRVTRVGRLLRRYSLDELPQLVNVVAGHMALIGPRPALPEEVARYSTEPRRRLAVKPGITGLWQVSGRSDLSWEESVRLDAGYVDNWSLGLDASILARTVTAVLSHRGAY